MSREKEVIELTLDINNRSTLVESRGKSAPASSAELRLSREKEVIELTLDINDG